ncbi:Hypothetical predicted protein [Paramuricea clavata]|uniref:Uncharacterized protein n=2 Tax=Paramuricea clavata TaxID=317549 RepID=A0A6S7IR71_PARCT|nr:Hypothetical predicted protein [Paramuricea clavata]
MTTKVNFAPLRVLTTGCQPPVRRSLQDKNKMAVPNSTENTLEINLNEVFVGKRRLRYIYQYEPNIVSTILDKNMKYMPLFLGCDVLDECSISSGNLPRFHAKHARRGLATKLNFQSGVRILGIHGTNRGVWFYSVQGLFKIAFEHYTREEQQDCLLKLRDVWERQILDPILMSEINVMFKNCIVEALTSETGEEKITSSTVDEFVNHVSSAIGSYIICKDNPSLQHEMELLKTYLSYINHKENLDSFLNRTINLVKNCLQCLSTFPEKAESLGSPPLSGSYTSYPDDNLTQSSRFPTESQSMNYANRQNLACKKFSKTQSFCYQEAVMLEIAQWLGTEFLKYQPDINERVTLFKQRNMSSIRNLPSAENLVNEVFPLSMLVFLCSWLQVPLSHIENDADTEKSDGRSNLFPVIQLILELANESLVSGVAHVLFSQLVQSDSVQ